MEKSNLTEVTIEKSELDLIDERIAELRYQIELKEALERLHSNPDFVLVMLQAYFENEGERLYGMLTEPSHLKRDSMENMMNKLTAIRDLKQFYSTVGVNGHMAPEQIESEEEYRKEVTSGNSFEE